MVSSYVTNAVVTKNQRCYLPDRQILKRKTALDAELFHIKTKYITVYNQNITIKGGSRRAEKSRKVLMMMRLPNWGGQIRSKAGAFNLISSHLISLGKTA